MSRYNLRSKKQAEQQKPVFIIDDVPYTADTVRKCQLNDENTVKLIDNGKLKEHGNGLFYSDKSGIRALIYLPDDLALSVLSYLHLKMHHPGSKCLASVFERHFTARNVQRLTNQVCTECAHCIMVKPKPALKSCERPAPNVAVQPWTYTYCDMIDFGSHDENGYRYCLGLFDGLTHFLIAAPLKDRSAQSVAHALSSLLLSQNITNGRVITDNEKSFQAVAPLLKKFNMTVGFISPYTPTGNRIERSWRDMKIKARILGLSQCSWSAELCYLLFVVNNTPSTSLDNLTPAECLTGRVLPLPLFSTSENEDIQCIDSSAWFSYIAGWSRNVGVALSSAKMSQFILSEVPISKTVILEPGTEVFYWRPQRLETSKKLSILWEGRAKVVEKLQAGSYKIMTEDNRSLIRNIRHLRPIPKTMHPKNCSLS